MSESIGAFRQRLARTRLFSSDSGPHSGDDTPKSFQSGDTRAASTSPAQWNVDSPIWATLERNFFIGTAGGIRVLVAVANPDRAARENLLHEAKILKKLPPHKHVQRLLYSSEDDEPTPHMTFKLMQPAGFDLDCLRNQFAFTGLCVPSTMMAAILRQLVNALNHLHIHGVIHRRLITKSILIDSKNSVILADMSDACLTGSIDSVKLGHVAPEVYKGGTPQGAEADCWGLGVLLHQVYQGSCDILEQGLNGEIRVVLVRRRAMPGDAMRAMGNLLALDRDERWTLQELCCNTWLRVCDMATIQPMTRIPPPQDTGRQYLRKFRSSGRLPAALAVLMTGKDHPHIVGKKLKDLRFSAFNVNVLLVTKGEGTFTTHPGADTIIEKGSWVYFGVACRGLTTNAFRELIENLKPPDVVLTPSQGKKKRMEQIRDSLSDGMKYISELQAKHKNDEDEDLRSSRLAELALEFDCFSFPEHVGEVAVIGPRPPESMPDCPALDIRKNLGLNLAGIKRPEQQDVEWFPGPQALVRPADLGLIVREPDMSGGSRPTLTDDKLQVLMDPQHLKSANSCGLKPVGSTRLPIASRSETKVHSSRPEEKSEPSRGPTPDVCARPDFPSPTPQLVIAEELPVSTFGPTKVIPEVASTFRPKSSEPGLTTSPGRDSSGLPNFLPALIMPWQRSREEIKKPHEPQEFMKPQALEKIQKALSIGMSPGIYEEQDPSYEEIDEDVWGPNGEIKESMRARGFYEDEEPFTSRGGLFELPCSPKANVPLGVYEDI